MSSGYLPCVFLCAANSLRSASAASLELVRRLRKCVHTLNLVFSLWLDSRERIDVSLLPMYNTTLPLNLPISYTPFSVIGRASITTLVKGIHLALIGIKYSLCTESLQPCYNNIVTAGGFEPPRQLSANSFQIYRACQLHHAVSAENLGEGSLPDRPSPESPYKKQYHKV